jgi:hypothetical protein
MDFVEEQGVSIVANGTFNPAIFHPSWLAKNGLITEDEEAASTVEIVHAEIAQFQVPGMRYDVQTERCSIHAVAEPFIKAADDFSTIFGEKLPHSPITSCGINYWAHFSLNSWKQRQAFGRLLAPIEPWGPFGQLLDGNDKETAGGFSTLAMRANHLKYGKGGSINVSMQPSGKVAADCGVFLHINHHFSKDDEETNFASMIVENFDSCVKMSREILSYMINKGRTL